MRETRQSMLAQIWYMRARSATITEQTLPDRGKVEMRSVPAGTEVDLTEFAIPDFFEPIHKLLHVFTAVVSGDDPTIGIERQPGTTRPSRRIAKTLITLVGKCVGSLQRHVLRLSLEDETDAGTSWIPMRVHPLKRIFGLALVVVCFVDEADPLSAAQVVSDVHDGLGDPLEARRIGLAERLPQVVASRHRLPELVHVDTDHDAGKIGIVDHLQQPDHECVAVLLGPTLKLTLEICTIDSVEDFDRPLSDVPPSGPILPLLAARDVRCNG